MDTQFEAVWQKLTPALIEAIIAFWTAENALPADQDARERAQQAVSLVRGSDGQILAVSTANIRLIARIGQPLYYFRMFTAPSWRGQQHGYALVEHTRDTLTAYQKTRPAGEAIGLVAEIENNYYRDRYPQASWPLGFNFIGYSRRRLPMYAYYFPGAALLPPVRLNQ